MRAPGCTVVGIACLMSIALANCASAPVSQAVQPPDAECDRVIDRVLRLLPRRPERLRVIDADTSPPTLQRAILEAEGFVTIGDRTVYLKRQGSTFRKALDGPGIFDYALAAIVWHEMAHLDGADEPEAQRQEETLWRQFILEQRVDRAKGLRFLKLLRSRRQ